MKLSLKPNKHDIFVGSFLLLIVISLVISLVTLNLFKDDKDHYAYIKYRGEIVYQMDLHKDEVFILHKDEEKYQDLHGDFEITVKNGKVGITNNVCPEDFCKHAGFIDTKGYSLICAPNKIVIEIGAKVNLDCDWGAC